MKERPIIFNSDEVRAILEGRKTMMRKPIKNKELLSYLDLNKTKGRVTVILCEDFTHDISEICPFGQPGDRLWVKETWRASNPVAGWVDCQYKTGMNRLVYLKGKEYKQAERFGMHRSIRDKWTSPILMPRWASRITLEIINVHVERLQDISEEDAKAEGFDASWLIWHEGDDAHNTRREEIYSKFGVEAGNTRTASERDEFAYLWDKLYAKRSYGWDTNPWVWVIEFKQVEATR